MNLAPLLVHSPDLPPAARAALASALAAAPIERDGAWQRAARALFDATDLTCGEAMDLVGLAASRCDAAAR